MKGSSLMFLVILVIVFYFLLILPQRRQQKKKLEMQKSLAPGSKVMTASGIYAEIVEMNGDVIVARIAEDVEIEMDQRAVVRVISEGTPYQTPDGHVLGAPEYDEDEDEEEEEASIEDGHIESPEEEPASSAEHKDKPL